MQVEIALLLSLTVVQLLPQYVRQDASVAEVLHLDGRIDADDDARLVRVAGGTADDEPGLLTRLRFGGAQQIEGLRAVELQRARVGAFLELAGEDAHHDEIRAVDALEALRHDRLQAEERGPLRRPVA